MSAPDERDARRAAKEAAARCDEDEARTAREAEALRREYFGGDSSP